MSTNRIPQFDGLRGIAAVVVVTSHIITGFFPAYYFGSGSASEYLLRSPLFVFWSGQFAVSVFFALSGFVIAASAARRGSPLIVQLPVRYLRLSLPMLASVLIAFGLLKLFPTSSLEASVLTKSHWLAANYRPPAPGFLAALYEATIGAFLNDRIYYNNPFWTMRYELVGSLLIYIIYRILPDMLVLLVCCAASVALMWLPTPWQNLLPMLFGVILFHFRARFVAIPPIVAGGAIVLALLLGGYPYISVDGSIYESLRVIFPAGTGIVVRAIGTVLILIGVLSSAPARRILTTGPIQFLGKISYPLYLVHFPILATVLAQARIYTDGHPALFAGCIAVYLIVVIAVATAFDALVDVPVVNAIARMKSRTAGEPTGRIEATS